MKKLVLSVVFAAAALAVQAGGDKCCGDCSSTKVQTSTDTKSQCCGSMTKETTKTKAAKGKELASKPILQSPKAKG
jgi:hypothetical protein